MGYKEVGKEWEYSESGDFIEGAYLEIETEVGPNKSNLYKLSIGPGEVLSVWGTTILDQRMRNVTIGDKIKITYLGLGCAKTGQHAPKLFKVEVFIQD